MVYISDEVLALARPILYAFHWLWTLCIFAVTADRLRGEQRVNAVTTSAYCHFGAPSMCSFVIGWGVIAWLAVTAVVGVYVAGVVGFGGGGWGLAPMAEAAIWVGATVWWAVGAIAISAAHPPAGNSGATAVEVFAWMLVLFSVASAGVSWAMAKREDKGGGDPGVAPDAPMDEPAEAYAPDAYGDGV